MVEGEVVFISLKAHGGKEFLASTHPGGALGTISRHGRSAMVVARRRPTLTRRRSRGTASVSAEMSVEAVMMSI